MARAERLIEAARRLGRTVDGIRFGPPVTHVYNPLGYAGRGYRRYLRRFAEGQKRAVFLGMNPGPFGMAQTGVPFGEVAIVRSWMGIEERIERPANEHPARPIEGFACRRSEVSGARLWGAVARRFERPEAFFRDHFVANYCPLVFMEASGRNRTPDKLAPDERRALYAACDDHLRRLVRILEPEWVIGVGGFAEARAREALAGLRAPIRPHPPPEPGQSPRQSRLGGHRRAGAAGTRAVSPSARRGRRVRTREK